MEKMLQSLLHLRCQTFLEKTYLRNSALSPGTVGRQGRVPAWLGARARAQQVLSRRMYPRLPDRGIFFHQKWPFLSSAECFMQERRLLFCCVLL